MNKIKIYIGKFILWTIGEIMPSYIYPLGKLSNNIRCVATKLITSNVGNNVIIERGAHIKAGVILYDNASVGEHCLISKGTIIHGHNFMGPNVRVFTSNHLYSEKTHSYNGYTEVKPVEIGAYSWIGYNVIILPGVKIGDNTIINKNCFGPGPRDWIRTSDLEIMSLTSYLAALPWNIFS